MAGGFATICQQKVIELGSDHKLHKACKDQQLMAELKSLCSQNPADASATDDMPARITGAASTTDQAAAAGICFQQGGACGLLGVPKDVSLASRGTTMCAFQGTLFNQVQLVAEYGPVLEEPSKEAACKYTPAQVVCMLYGILGADLLAMLRGSFALCLYESRLMRVLAARDGSGTIPLYQGRMPGSGSLILATDMSTLTQHAVEHVVEFRPGDFKYGWHMEPRRYDLADPAVQRITGAGTGAGRRSSFDAHAHLHAHGGGQGHARGSGSRPGSGRSSSSGVPQVHGRGPRKSLDAGSNAYVVYSVTADSTSSPHTVPTGSATKPIAIRGRNTRSNGSSAAGSYGSPGVAGLSRSVDRHQRREQHTSLGTSGEGGSLRSGTSPGTGAGVGSWKLGQQRSQKQQQGVLASAAGEGVAVGAGHDLSQSSRRMDSHAGAGGKHVTQRPSSACGEDRERADGNLSSENSSGSRVGMPTSSGKKKEQQPQSHAAVEQALEQGSNKAAAGLEKLNVNAPEFRPTRTLL